MLNLENIPRLTAQQAHQMFKEGRLQGFYKMADVDYFASPGVNQSTLKTMLKCPASYQTALHFQKHEKKKHFDMGTAIHLLILEGKAAFSAVCCKAPEGNPRTKVYQEAKKALEAEGKIVFSQSEWQQIHDIYHSYLNSPFAQTCLSNGASEITCFATHPHYGYLMKIKIDYINSNVLLDLKTTISASSLNFPKSARKNGYAFQAAFYMIAANSALGQNYFRQFAWVAVEKSPPYLWNYFTISQFDLMKAADEVNKCFAKLRECQQKNSWPGFTPRFKTINFQEWRNR